MIKTGSLKKRIIDVILVILYRNTLLIEILIPGKYQL